jgi:predicted HTH domain antitoxin
MTTLTVEMPETVFSALRVAPDSFVQEMRQAAAIKWYEMRRVSQDKATEIAGFSRADFIDSLSLARVSVVQITEDELKREVAYAG